ncbi:N-formylglutamate amidohydrolase (plasmid) [Legionella adelaidensis]|uniref:N-formylglutamate amidohydrolase n=1 Tax=Legionella adelaidensis TaxID=45056 RepID=A0A0W0R2H8_9GAMM|nr:N-formylglutamate amidohydrolase [Legionella adelaidensis]KTC65256.1 N-formylglutamate amidohydrolase [Legionella adelaidensis]VEH86217.1 N-formylglutamate amidohydrolase [Legionella adelaidensis]
MKSTRIVISCEHAQEKVPKEYAHLFATHKEIKESHEGYDFGALEIARFLSKALDTPFSYSQVNRLLIDCNRSLSNPRCFSKFTRALAKKEKQTLIDNYYLPYREETEKNILNLIKKDYQVLHLAIHSFTPMLNGVRRNTAIGLLYDPKRHGEAEVARAWHGILKNQQPHYKVRKNYPYKGNTDGFTTSLRKKHNQMDYLGIEVECNQALLHNKKSSQHVAETLLESLHELLQFL